MNARLKSGSPLNLAYLNPQPVQELPNCIEAEQALLGAILMNNEAMEHVADFLRPEHFYEPLHGQIFDACSKQIGAGRRATPVMLNPFFAGQPPVGDLTVPQYLGRLVSCATSVLNAKDYGNAVHDTAIRRELISLSESLISAAYSASVDQSPAELIQEAEKRLYSLGQHGAIGTEVSAGEAMCKALAVAENAYESGSGLCGLSTGIASLDELLGGLSPGNVIVLAGRPAMGKSALAGNIAVNVASAASTMISGPSGSVMARGCPVGFLSQEMTDVELGGRIMSAQSEVPGSLIRRGRFTENQYLIMKRVAEAGHSLPLYFDTCGGLTPQQVVTKARRWVRKRKIGLLIVDYLQLMSAPGSIGEYAKVTEAMATFKPLAKELNIPIIVLSQLSRKCEEREDKRPTMADLKSSGSIEQDADVVLLVYRDEYYVSKKEPPVTKADDHQKWCDEMAACAGLAEIILGKGRHIGDGKVTVRFNGDLTLFQD